MEGVPLKDFCVCKLVGRRPSNRSALIVPPRLAATANACRHTRCIRGEGTEGPQGGPFRNPEKKLPCPCDPLSLVSPCHVRLLAGHSVPEPWGGGTAEAPTGVARQGERHAPQTDVHGRFRRGSAERRDTARRAGEPAPQAKAPAQPEETPRAGARAFRKRGPARRAPPRSGEAGRSPCAGARAWALVKSSLAYARDHNHRITRMVEMPPCLAPHC